MGNKIDEETFLAYTRHARRLKSEYGVAYASGIRWHYYGARFGNPTQHKARLRKGGDYGRGYLDGLAGNPPTPLIGRPAENLRPDGARRPRAVRLGDAHWSKLRQLGTRWLEQMIDEAPDALPLPH